MFEEEVELLSSCFGQCYSLRAETAVIRCQHGAPLHCDMRWDGVHWES